MNRKGFAPIVLIFVVVAVILTGAVGYFALNRKGTPTSIEKQSPINQISPTQPSGSLLGPTIRDDSAIEIVKKHQALYRWRHPNYDYVYSPGQEPRLADPRTLGVAYDGGNFFFFLKEESGKRVPTVNFVDISRGGPGAAPEYIFISNDAILFQYTDRLGFKAGLTYYNISCKKTTGWALPDGAFPLDVFDKPVYEDPYILVNDLENLLLLNIITGGKKLIKLVEKPLVSAQVTVQGIAYKDGYVYWVQYHDFTSELYRGYKRKLSLDTDKKVKCSDLSENGVLIPTFNLEAEYLLIL